MSTEQALKLIGVVRGTYNSWCQNNQFVEIYRQCRDNAADWKQEAIQLLRRDNQLDAVLMEAKVITRMKEELDSGEYQLIRSHLAREVYGKLITDLDAQPDIALTWEQRILNLGVNPNQIGSGQVIDGEVREIEPDVSQEALVEAQDTQEGKKEETERGETIS